MKKIFYNTVKISDNIREQKLNKRLEKNFANRLKNKQKKKRKEYKHSLSTAEEINGNEKKKKNS